MAQQPLMINDTPAYVGTSGYTHDDWKGPFYPEDIEGSDMLPFYSSRPGLNFLELTFTFYKLPFPETIANIARRAPDDFSFSVRLHKSFLKGVAPEEDYGAFQRALDPLIDSGRLKGFIADFLPDFGASKEHLHWLTRLRSRFTSAPLFAELPSRSWYKERYIEELRAMDVGLVTIDMPKKPGFTPYVPQSTNHYGYFRLYGRNPGWVKPDKKKLSYRYPKETLDTFIEDAGPMTILGKGIFFSFCNVAKANAPLDAIAFAEKLAGGK